MALSTISIGGQDVTLVDLPSYPGPRTIQFDFDDPAAALTSGFSNQSQIQRWPGADLLSGTFSLPPLTQVQADLWTSFLLLLRGQANAFLLRDPLRLTPRGNPQRSQPLTSGNTISGTDQLTTNGWSGAGRLLEPGDWVQIGYRLYRNLLPVLSSDGTATLTLWPSVREPIPGGTAIVLHNAAGLFRLAQSKRTVSTDYTRLSAISIPFVEWRGPSYA